MYNIVYCLVFLYCVCALEANPMQCYRRNEILDCDFGCPPERTCRNRGIQFNCLQSEEPCRPKCVCKKGFIRNAIEECVPEEICDKCTGDHEFFSCGSECDNECSTLDKYNQTNCPIVNIICNEKCYCEEGYARNENGVCIPIEECPNINNVEKRSPRNNIKNKPSSICPPNEEYTSCKKSCPPETCISLVARFKCDSTEECTPGCVCKPNFLRKTSDAPCTPIRECPELSGSPDFNV